jgi:tetratricopeptide (TPR) repeat protein
LAKSVADSLAKRYGEHSGDIAADLAVLYEDAREPENAARYYFQAAENTIDLHAFPEASALAERGHRAAQKLAPEQRGALLLEHAFLKIRMHQNQGNYEDVTADCHATENLAIELGDTLARVDAICALANALFYLKQLNEAGREAARALAIAREAGSDLAIASAEATVALIRLSVGDLAEAETYFDRAIPVIRATTARPSAVDSISYRLLLHAWRLEYDEIETAAQWVRESSLRAGATLCMIYFARAMASGNQGRLGEALEFAREGQKLAELNEDKYFISRMPNVIAWLSNEADDVKNSFALNEESLVLAYELGFEEAAANAHVNLAALHCGLGELDQADQHIKTAEQLFEEDIWFRWRYNIRLQATKAGISIARGELKSAGEYAQTALVFARDSLARKHVAVARKLHGDIAALEDRIEDSITNYRDALQCLSEHPCPAIQWKTSLALANSLRKSGLDAEADTLAGNAKRQLSEVGKSIRDKQLRRTFYAAKNTRDLGIQE